MALPDIVTREQWLTARTALLNREKAFTRARDELGTARRNLPMVRVDRDYRFTSPDGTAELAELFAGRRQLIVQHVMFDPSWEQACQSCSAAVDEISDGLLAHLAARDTTLVLVSRAPIDAIERYRAERGWTVPWFSSYGSDFNYDFHVSLDASKRPVEFNYRDESALREAGQGWLLDGPSEQPGYSCFLADGGQVFHTYSTFARGCEQLGGSYAFLDMTALGRQEAWEEPKGRAEETHGADPSFSD